MVEWIFLAAPALLLPIFLLFRFVGCAQIAGLKDPEPVEPVGTTQPDPKPPGPIPPPAQDPPLVPIPTNPPNYPKYILGEPNNPGMVKNNTIVPNGADVIAYWRFIDAVGSPDARDEKQFQNGEYRQGHVLPTIAPTQTVAGSQGRDPAQFIHNQGSLIASEPPTVQCRYFDGGYVLVPYKPGLYSDQFTIEAWIKADLFAQGYEHSLFDAGGTFASPAGTPAVGRGFRIFVDRDRAWQVSLNNSAAGLFAAPPLVPLGARTHIALTVENDAAPGAKKCVLYVDAKVAGTVSVPAYAPPHDAPLFIGIENKTTVPTGTPTLRNPVLCRIQEVVLHRKALSALEIENHVDMNR